LFRRLAVFVDGCTPEAAEAVAGGQDENHLPPVPLSPSVLHRLGALVDKSLLWQEPQPDGEPRFRMLETIREFGLERLRARGEESAVRAAHADYYLTLAEQAELRLIAVGSATWVERLATERANLRAAVAWALAHGQAEAVLRLAGTLLSYGYARGKPADGLAWLEAALTIRGDAPAASPVAAP